MCKEFKVSVSHILNKNPLKDVVSFENVIEAIECSIETKEVVTDVWIDSSHGVQSASHETETIEYIDPIELVRVLKELARYNND